MRVLVTGASRGIGLEFVRQLSARGDEVWALCRKPSPELTNLKPAHLLTGVDLTSAGLEAELQDQLKELETLDCLINNAGQGVEMSTPITEVKPEHLRELFEVNSIAPLRVLAAVLPQLKKASQPKIIQVSSRMGSISDNDSGKAYGYRMSKAALNMMNKSFSIDEPQIISVVVHPGWVQTDLGGKQAPVKASDSVRGLLTLVDQLSPRHSGRFFDYKGTELPF